MKTKHLYVVGVFFTLGLLTSLAQNCNYCADKGPDVEAKLAAERTGPPYFPAPHHHKWGYINAKGKMVIAPRFTMAGRFCEGLARVRVLGEMEEYATKSRVFSMPEHASINPPSDLKHPEPVNNKWGYINTSFEFVVPPIFDEASDFSEGLAYVSRGKESGYIETNGVLLVPVRQDQVELRGFREGLTPVEEQGKWGFMNKSGKIVIKAGYDEVWPFSEGLARVKQDGLFGYVNTRGALIIKAEYEEALDFSEGLAAVQINGDWGYINPKNKIVIKPAFELAFSFSEGLAPVMQNGKMGFINPEGKFVIDAAFDWVRPFSEGLACVDVQGYEKGFIDKTGKLIFGKLSYDVVNDFENGLAFVGPAEEDSIHAGYVGKNGEAIWASDPRQK